MKNDEKNVQPFDMVTKQGPITNLRHPTPTSEVTALCRPPENRAPNIKIHTKNKRHKLIHMKDNEQDINTLTSVIFGGI
jgi:hypothetical protein